MPALSAKEQAAAGLTSIIELLQNADIRAALLRAQTADELRAALGS
jgi:mannitol/fructose-specific phosphotransferase system IIA component (Ntr-type)